MSTLSRNTTSMERTHSSSSNRKLGRMSKIQAASRPPLAVLVSRDSRMALQTQLRLMRPHRKVTSFGRIQSSELTARHLDGMIMVSQCKEALRHQRLCCGKDHQKWDKAIQRLLLSGVTMKSLFPMELSSSH